MLRCTSSPRFRKRATTAKPTSALTRKGGFHIVEVAANSWFKPDQSEEIVDVCYSPWPFIWEESDFDIRYFSADIAATKTVMAAQDLGVGNEVAFAGLFVNHHGKKRNEPIVRFGHISAMLAEPVSTQHGEIEAYLIESRSVGGLSGSPVFIDPGLFRFTDDGQARRYRAAGEPGGYLLGVMHGHWDAPKEAAEVDAKEAPEVDYFGISKEYINMGIAAVTPIDKVLKLIDDSPLRAMIDAAREHPTGPQGSAVVLRLDADMKPIPGEIIVLPRDRRPSGVDDDTGQWADQSRARSDRPTEALGELARCRVEVAGALECGPGSPQRRVQVGEAG
ncbi:MAG TPA: hypothetical protein VLZ05_19850, partial [Mycobacterium sp.]